ncbi:hypothetical protein [Clostridium oryzae]|uniref:Uncharacterized protein n=1 Tax=Clostridium oryzae TaxID=1450648 RepID=A0A1V4IHN2_9CLOT|nr:hypothetical protein [Clostridium oryzae]OPJ59436.1 hypothetical protein CLORY_32780 [Clostridium oryzae]
MQQNTPSDTTVSSKDNKNLLIVVIIFIVIGYFLFKRVSPSFLTDLAKAYDKTKNGEPEQKGKKYRPHDDRDSYRERRREQW